MLRILIRDPVPFRPLDPGWVKNQDPDPEIRIRGELWGDISESLETIFWLKYFLFFDADADPDPDLQH